MRIARGISIANTSKPISTAIIYDADAVAFFTAASITDTTQKSAVNQLVLDLKSASIWAKMKALYPVVGGVASAHAVNLKTPGTYNLTFATGWTHANTGMTPLNTYADSNLTLQGQFGTSDMHFSYYSRTNVGGNADMGMTTWSSPYTYLYIKTTSNTIGGRVNTSNPEASISNTNSLGLFSFNRKSSTVVNIYRNGVGSNINQTATGIPTGKMTIGGMFSGAWEYGNKQCAFASIGDGLTDAEASSFYTAVQTFQTTLGRQV